MSNANDDTVAGGKTPQIDLAVATTDELVAELGTRSGALVLGMIENNSRGEYRTNYCGSVLSCVGLNQMLAIELNRLLANSRSK